MTMILDELSFANVKQITNTTNGTRYRNAIKWFTLTYNQVSLDKDI